VALSPGTITQIRFHITQNHHCWSLDVRFRQEQTFALMEIRFNNRLQSAAASIGERNT
jgi:hypothetical protein